ncbi:MAG: beta-lactamase [Hyphomicrobiales bacterium]|nr:beta-lactamase [Hyphomicrobiales bacterium]
MMIDRRTLMAGAGALAVAHATAASAQTLDERRIETAALRFMKRNGAPGLQIGVLTPSGARVFPFGLASRETGTKVDGSTLFEIGSISKTFTAALAALAVEGGKAGWNDPASRHVPELKGSQFDNVSLLQLATHTMGGMPLQLPESVRSHAELIAYYRSWKPDAPAGSTRSYANPSIGLLGMATARALQGDFATLMQKLVLQPLGLLHTDYDVPTSQRVEEAQGYRRDGGEVRLSAAPLAREAYGLRTTAGDLLRFLQAQLDAEAATTPLGRALRSTQVGHYKSGALTQALIWEWYPAEAGWARLVAGNSEDMTLKSTPVEPIVPPQRPDAGAIVNKTGATNGFGAYVAFIPERRIAIVLLANRNHATAGRLELAREIFSSLGVPQAAGPADGSRGGD